MNNQRFLQDDDFAALQRFMECCEDDDADGHDVPKDRMARLRELGVVQSFGFGRNQTFQTTSFGYYVSRIANNLPENLPLKTFDDIDAEHRARMAQILGGKS
jgi:hypothetical protein